MKLAAFAALVTLILMLALVIGVVMHGFTWAALVFVGSVMVVVSALTTMAVLIGVVWYWRG